VKRSTRRRQDAPNLPGRPVENRTTYHQVWWPAHDVQAHSGDRAARYQHITAPIQRDIASRVGRLIRQVGEGPANGK
jgi:hypothetical protein